MDLTFNSAFIAFNATSSFSYFPVECGNDSYELRSHDYERMRTNQIHTFDSHVKVFIPKNHKGIIDINPEFENMINITPISLNENQWHDIKFTFRYIGSSSAKIHGEWGIAILTIIHVL